MPQLKEFNLTMKPEGQSAPMTREQLMAAERDAKRRRIKHRSAKVHTKSKNYSEVLREVINNQMGAYEDWIKENFGSVNMPESSEPEKQIVEVAKQEKQDMVWLDWDLRGNPHTRWKYILEKEKRRRERQEDDADRSRNNKEKETEKNYKERKRYRDESTSRIYRHKEESRKRENHERMKKDEYHSGRRNESSRKERCRSRNREEEERMKYDRYKKHPYGDDLKLKYKTKESKSGDDHKSKYKDRKNQYYTDTESLEQKDVRYSHKSNDISSEIHVDKCNVNYELEQDIRIKEEVMEDDGQSCSSHNYKSLAEIKLKKDSDGGRSDADTSSGSSQSSSSKKAKKRKKSKKKHKHKHSKKHKKDHS